MKYDIAIIGGGPAGMMAAIRAAELGSKVVLIEKNEKLGVKLLSTGGGRCNVTNNISDPKKLASFYEPNQKFLISAFTRFGAAETISFFNEGGVGLKEEENGRVFPLSDRADDILKLLLEEIRRLGVKIMAGSAVKDIVFSKGKIDSIIAGDKKIEAKNYLIATGGRSYPGTGSTGEAYFWLGKIGHQIVTPRPALVQIIVSDYRSKIFEGISFEDAELSFWPEGDKKIVSRGSVIFTAKGLSGPAALNLSRFIKSEKGVLEIDFFPDKEDDDFEEELNNSFHAGKKSIKNVLETLLAPKLAGALINFCALNPEHQANSIKKEKRKEILAFLKHLPFSLVSLGGFQEAMVTGGGVALSEIDPKTMRSKLCSNLFLAGEIIDLTGPTGGYNLQLCWSTGYIAGENASR